MAKKEKQNKETEKTEALPQKPEFELIKWDLKSKLFIGVCTGLFFIFVFFKIHNSSVPIWNQVSNDGGSMKRGLISGKPQSIRSDEWLVLTPFIISQAENNFKSTNESLGYGKPAILMGLPTSDFISYFKPALWGFYLFDLERGYSWYWNIKIFPFLISAFLLFMLLLNNNFWLSVFGSLWILLSSSIIWWSINTEIFFYIQATTVCLFYILFSKNTKQILIASLLFILFGYSFVAVLYPAYQVPLVYFYTAVLVGFIITKKDYLKIGKIQIYCLSTALFSLGILIFLFYSQTKETIHVIMSTVYPGLRNEVGGGIPFVRLFTDIFSIFMDENKFPPSWGNICELSNYLMFAPFVMILVCIKLGITKKVDYLLLFVFVFHTIGIVWITIGLPSVIAKMLLLHMSPSYRMVYIFGYSNIVFTLVYISKSDLFEWQKYISHKILSFVVLFLLAYLVVYFLNSDAKNYFTNQKVFFSSLIFAVLLWLLYFIRINKVVTIVFGLCVLLFCLPNIKVQPFSKGLTPVTENNLYKSVKSIVKQNPKAKWVVFGQFTYSNFLKTTGANVVSGVKYTPDLPTLRKLNDSPKADSIYNRYAHISFYPMINGRDSIAFSLLQSDAYAIQIDPCMDKMKNFGVKYVFFAYNPQAAEVRCMTLVSNMGYNIYKINE